MIRKWSIMSSCSENGLSPKLLSRSCEAADCAMAFKQSFEDSLDLATLVGWMA